MKRSILQRLSELFESISIANIVIGVAVCFVAAALLSGLLA